MKKLCLCLVVVMMFVMTAGVAIASPPAVPPVPSEVAPRPLGTLSEGETMMIRSPLGGDISLSTEKPFGWPLTPWVGVKWSTEYGSDIQWFFYAGQGAAGYVGPLFVRCYTESCHAAQVVVYGPNGWYRRQ